MRKYGKYFRTPPKENNVTKWIDSKTLRLWWWCFKSLIIVSNTNFVRCFWLKMYNVVHMMVVECMSDKVRRRDTTTKNLWTVSRYVTIVILCTTFCQKKLDSRLYLRYPWKPSEKCGQILMYKLQMLSIFFWLRLIIIFAMVQLIDTD